MPDANKPRLYVAMYPTPSSTKEEPKYHWALMIGPKREKSSEETPGTRFHVKNTQSGDGTWQYDEETVKDVKNTTNLLARILVAKIEDQQRVFAILRSVPIIQGDDNWRCHTWVINALAALQADGTAVGTSTLEWQRIQSSGESFVAQKIAAGRYGEKVNGPRPLFDLLKGKEITP